MWAWGVPRWGTYHFVYVAKEALTDEVTLEMWREGGGHGLTCVSQAGEQIQRHCHGHEPRKPRSWTRRGWLEMRAE